MNVELVKFTDNAGIIVTNAAKLCYANNADAIFDIKEEEIEKFINSLKNMGHLSPFEHVAYTFYAQDISRVTSHQLVRHRIASYSQRSQRYVKHNAFSYIAPPSLQGKTVEIEAGKTMGAEMYYDICMQSIADMYNKLNNALGDCGEESNQDARYILPNACETKIFVTMNARELMYFLGERLCMRAQWEIRDLANAMLLEAKKVSPYIFNGIGPKCIQLDGCPEEKMSCGQFSDMLEKYK